MAITTVHTELIASDAVTGAKIADDAVDSEHYTDGSIDTAHIADNAITSAKIAAGVVVAADIANDSIDSQHYVDGSIDLAHMSVNSIDSDQYVDGSIDTAHLADDAVTSAKLDTNIAVGGTLDVTGITTIGTGSGEPQLVIDKADANTGTLRWAKGGSNEAYIQYDASEDLVYYTTSGSDHIFKSHGSSLMTLASGSVDIAGTLGTSGVVTMSDSVSGDNAGLILKNTNADSNPATLWLQKDSASPADSDDIGKIEFQGDDDAGNVTRYGLILCKSEDVSNGSEDGSMTFNSMVAGSSTNWMHYTNKFVGINTTSPTRAFDLRGVSGSNYAFSVTMSDSTIHVARFYSNGSCGLAFHADDSNNLFRINSEGSNDDLTLEVSDGEEALRITSNKHVKVKYAAYTEQVAITSSSNATAWDARAAANAYYATSENTTFSAPTNAVEGAVISVEIAQGGTARTVAWNTIFEFAASTAPTITATANKTDILTFRYNGSVWQEIGRVQNMAQT